MAWLYESLLSQSSWDSAVAIHNIDPRLPCWPSHTILVVVFWRHSSWVKLLLFRLVLPWWELVEPTWGSGLYPIAWASWPSQCCLLVGDWWIANGWHEQAVKLGYGSVGDLPTRLLVVHGRCWLQVCSLSCESWVCPEVKPCVRCKELQSEGLLPLLGCSVCGLAVLLSLLRWFPQSQMQLLWSKSSILAVPAPATPERFVFSPSRFSSYCSW